MKLNVLAANQTEGTLNGNTIFFSYNTPVAAFVPGRGCLVTEQYYSRTTSKHVNAWARNTGGTVTMVPQSEINALAGA